MNQIEAKSIVEKTVMDNKHGFSLMESYTKEYSTCFVFYYQNDAYIKSGRFQDMSLGQGPVIVCKKTGKVFETGSAYSTEHYISAFEACGDPHGVPTSKIVISSGSEGENAVKAIRCLKAASGCGLSEAKSKIDEVLKGNSVVVELTSVDKVTSTLSTLKLHGFECVQLWSNQC